MEWDSWAFHAVIIMPSKQTKIANMDVRKTQYNNNNLQIFEGSFLIVLIRIICKATCFYYFAASVMNSLDLFPQIRKLRTLPKWWRWDVPFLSQSAHLFPVAHIIYANIHMCFFLLEWIYSCAAKVLTMNRAGDLLGRPTAKGADLQVT